VSWQPDDGDRLLEMAALVSMAVVVVCILFVAWLFVASGYSGG
jgi:hypothetical protein